MKAYLIFIFSILSIYSFGQIPINPNDGLSTKIANTAITGHISSTDAANNYTGLLPGWTSYPSAFDVRFTHGNTGSATFNLNGIGAKTFKKYSGGSLVNLVSGDIPDGAIVRFQYDGTYLVMMGGSGTDSNAIHQGSNTLTKNFVIKGDSSFSVGTSFANGIKGAVGLYSKNLFELAVANHGVTDYVDLNASMDSVAHSNAMGVSVVSGSSSASLLVSADAAGSQVDINTPNVDFTIGSRSTDGVYTDSRSGSAATGIRYATDLYGTGFLLNRSLIDLGTYNRRVVKRMARAATTANITLSGTQTVDGIALVANDICLVKNQTTASGNGPYIVKSGSWVRVDEFDDTNDYSQGALFPVRLGSANAGTMWMCTNTGSITFGSTSITIAKFNSVAGAAGGSDTYVQFNDSGNLSGSNGSTYSKSTKTTSLQHLKLKSPATATTNIEFPTINSISPDTPTNYGSFWQTISDSTYNNTSDGRWDAVYQWGWNQDGNGGRRNSLDAEAHWALENHYDPGGIGHPQFELHFQTQNTSNVVTRHFSMNINKASNSSSSFWHQNNMTWFSSLNDTSYFNIANTGEVNIFGSNAFLDVSNNAASNPGSLRISAQAAGAAIISNNGSGIAQLGGKWTFPNPGSNGVILTMSNTGDSDGYVVSNSGTSTGTLYPFHALEAANNGVYNKTENTATTSTSDVLDWLKTDASGGSPQTVYTAGSDFMFLGIDNADGKYKIGKTYQWGSNLFLSVSQSGQVTVPTFSSAGVVVNDASGNLSTTTFAASSSIPPTAQASGRNFLTTDNGAIIVTSNGSPINMTFTTGLPIGDHYRVAQGAAGAVVVSGGGGTTVTPSTLSTTNAGDIIEVFVTGTSTCIIKLLN